MDVLIIVLIILGALIAIASGIWVAFALGSAISTDRKKKNSTNSIEDS